MMVSISDNYRIRKVQKTGLAYERKDEEGFLLADGVATIRLHLRRTLVHLVTLFDMMAIYCVGPEPVCWHARVAMRIAQWSDGKQAATAPSNHRRKHSKTYSSEQGDLFSV
jgi:hypothetical protein